MDQHVYFGKIIGQKYFPTEQKASVTSENRIIIIGPSLFVL